MELQRPFLALTPTVDGDVLYVLARAEAAFTPPQVQRVIGRRSEAGVRRALTRLAEQGVVRADRAGQAVQYQLNREHLAADAITAIARLRETLVVRLREAVEGWALATPYAAMFGSAARGTMTPSSDIDLFVVRGRGIAADDDAWRAQVDTLETTVHRWTGNDAQVLEYGEDDSHTVALDPVLGEIMHDGIVLAGDRTYIHAWSTVS
jgi:hypothetical protein